MTRVTARLPESVPDLCLVRLGLEVRRWSAYRYALSLGRAIDRSSAVAIATGAGLLHSERYAQGWRRFGYWQYWSGFDAMEAWTRRPPHSDWWRDAVDRLRTRGDFGIFHEAYVIPAARVEGIALNCAPAGLFAFAAKGEPVGADTNSRGRLGLRRDA